MILRKLRIYLSVSLSTKIYQKHNTTVFIITDEEADY